MRSLLDLTAKIVTAHLANNRLPANAVLRFLDQVHATLTRLNDGERTLTTALHSDLSTAPSLNIARPDDATMPFADSQSSIVKEAALISSEPIAEKPPTPAVPISESILPERIICLEDGASVVLLKRHLRINFQMTPAQYRRRWSLPIDYPMTAPNYAERKRAIALGAGLGKSVRPPLQRQTE